MSCPDCEELSEEGARHIVRLAYGPMPEDGELMTGEQIRTLARRVIEDALKIPTILRSQKWDATP